MRKSRIIKISAAALAAAAVIFTGYKLLHKNDEISPDAVPVQQALDELKDYKLFCFDGLVKFLFVATDRGVEGEDTKFDFFDECFNHMDIRNGHKNATRKIECPLGFEEMKKYAALLSKGFPEVRVDFYDVNGRVYFGEMTFYHWGGLMPFEPEKWDEIFGSYIQLPEE